MLTDGCRLMVGVFDLGERADRARAELVAAGHAEASVRVMAEPDEAAGCAAALAAGGVPAEAVAYYAGELRAGRFLLAVECPPAGVGGVLGAFGRHGGSLCVPPAVRSGTA